MSSSRARNRRKWAAPSVAALGASGAVRSAAPPARSAETLGPPISADSERGARTSRRAGPLKHQPFRMAF
eukprot:15470423-Alexandrium_andersonii.AAC.1